MRRCGPLFIALSVTLFAPHSFAEAQIKLVDGIKQKIESINSMRESLASTLDGRSEPITDDTFKAVCMPVGQELNKWAKDKGYTARQVSIKNRNSKNELTKSDQKNVAEFDSNEHLKEKVIESEFEGKKGLLIYQRINVVTSCLHCHGEKNARPQFITTKYPQDKAYGFKVGDLRGFYSVFVPSEALKEK